MYAWTAGGSAAAAGGVVAAAGAAVLAVAVVTRLSTAIPWAVALAGAGYAVAHARNGTVDGWAAAVGAALLLAAELAAWSNEDDRLIRAERQVVLRRAGAVGALVAASAVVSFVLVGAAALSASAGLLLTAIGIAAAVGAVALVLRLART